jgi:hypothetical protein
VWLRPIEEADLDVLSRLDTDPSTRGPYLSSSFRSPHAWSAPLGGGRLA